MNVKLFDSELKVMEVLWKEGDMTAGQLAKILNEQVGWNRNTTYTIIKKLVEKEAIRRYEPNFTCRALISKQNVQKQEVKELFGKLFDNSAEAFLSAFFSSRKLSPEEIDGLKEIVEKLK
ncbi:BlaI/MecI/CopY family transcriptional regulator [Clostridiales bacterium COT073_COT-073]|nr:BlaI/MecI/CopY family transcriptional regulator [Clostridiales bacterium COT073_COT-073]